MGVNKNVIVNVEFIFLSFSNLSEISEWKSCESYIFDKSLRNSTNIMFGNGEEWETAVTQFELVCENDWINSLERILKILNLQIILLN